MKEGSPPALAPALAERPEGAADAKARAAEGGAGPGESGNAAAGSAGKAAEGNEAAGKGAGVDLGAAAESGGGLRWEGGAWVGWEAAGGWLRWALPVGLRGGGYGLELSYGSGGAGQLPLGIREDFHRLERKVEVPGPGVLGEASWLRLGTLRVRPGATFLEIKVGEAGTAADFRLMGVRLMLEGGA